MMIKLAPALLLSVLSVDDCTAFNAARPAAISRTALSMSNDFDNHYDYDVEVDRRGNIQNISESKTKRRDALSRFAATTAVATTAFLGASDAAFAAGAPTTEFSESGVSDASIARMTYDGKTIAPPQTAPAAPVPDAKAAAPKAAAKPTADFDGNEAGAIGSTDEGTQSKFEPRIALPGGTLEDLDPRLLIGGVAVGVAALAVGSGSGREEESSPNATAEGEVEKPKWALDLPTPYGVANGGKNPFLKEVLEYDAGKVTNAAAETITTYLEDVSNTGAVATTEEVKVITGYLDSIDDASNAPAGKKVGAAFTSYLDALAEGSAPPPSSNKAVKTYLDTVAGNTAPPAAAASVPVEAAPGAWEADFAEFDNRLTNIEGRVTSLESKVDEIPDKVFEKIEAWQVSQEERLSAQVKEIVGALTPPAPIVEAAAPAAPVVVEEAAPAAPIVVEEAAPPAEVAYGNPVGEIPFRGGMPQSGTPVKKGFGFGSGGSSWKSGGFAPAPASSEPAPVVPEPVAVAEPVVSEPVAPPVQANPIGAIPDRGGMPKASAPMKKGYGFGGGASWKNVSP